VVKLVLVRHGFSRDMADMLLEDTKRGIDYLKQHAPLMPQTAAEGTTFTHSAVAAVPAPAAPPRHAGKPAVRSVHETLLA